MPTDYLAKLQKLGVHKGTRRIVAPPPKRQRGLGALIDGELFETDYGSTFVHVERYAPDHLHGHYALGLALSQPMTIAAELADMAGDSFDLRRAAFIDTETTGLAGGTGTLAFLIGVGTFEADQSFVVRQYFLRSPDEEMAMLLHLSETLDQCDALVSFNGRGFDLPLLTTRFTLMRLRPRILAAPHLDLLLPARRVWRGRLASCALSSLEDHVLGVRREQADIDGSLIPQLYFDYVRTGDASEMPRVVYHNVNDILSMVTLSAHLIQLFDQSQAITRTPGDWLALGKWHADHARLEEAEQDLQRALAASGETDARQMAAHRLATLYKSLDRRAEAIVYWEQTAEFASAALPLAIDACEEIAKHYEWHDVQLAQAQHWTQRALNLAARLPGGFAKDDVLAQLTHRLDRVARKQNKNPAV